MATYQELKGAKIKNYTEDPDNPYVGQLWYNTTTDSLRIRKETSGNAWSSGGDLNTARGEGGSAGTQTAALAFGGETPPDIAITEAYNGSTWTELNDLNATRRVQGSNGTQTSALSYGGVPVPTHDETELWNGTNWTEVNDLNTGRRSLSGAGADNTSALAFGGRTPGTPDHDQTELWNGTNWTEVNDLNAADRAMGSFGVATSALAFGGEDQTTEIWNGSVWYEVNDLNTERQSAGGAGTVPSGIAFAGGPPFIANTELWNGTNWTEDSDMSVARYGLGSGGDQTAAIGFAGFVPGSVKSTEEWNQNLVAGSWITAGTMNTSRNNLNGNGAVTTTAGLVAGGNPPFRSEAEIYNGNVWAEVNDLNKGRYGVAVEGTQTSALAFGGVSGDPSPENAGFTREGKTETWNGTSWTEVNDMNVRKSDTQGAGADNTAALSVCGKNPQTNPPSGILVNTETWNGTNWTAVNDANENREAAACVGTSTQSLVFGGSNPGGNVKATESWNGTNWTEVNDLNLARYQLNGAGIYTAVVAHGGYSTAAVANTELWNGTNWTNQNAMPTAKQGQAGIGTSSSALAAGGHPTDGSSFEWVGEGIVTETVE